MEKQKSLWATGGLNRESPGGAIRAMLGGVRRVEEGARLPSGVVLSHGSGRPRHSGGIVISSPGSSRPSGVVAILGSGPNQHSGKVAEHSLGSSTYPGGFNPPVLEPVYPGRLALGPKGLGCTTQDAV